MYERLWMFLSKLLKVSGNADWKKTIKNKDEYVSESIFDFGVWHKATARRNTRPFDSNITEC